MQVVGEKVLEMGGSFYVVVRAGEGWVVRTHEDGMSIVLVQSAVEDAWAAE
jgi:hypothetical protein